MDNLPVHVFLEILLLLPVKSLLGLKLVCKSWRSHISNREFVKRHVLRTRNNPNNDLFIIVSLSASSGPYADKLSVNNVNFVDRAISLNIPIPVSDDIYDLDYVVGSCNGLLCLAYVCNPPETSQHKLYLWNPATTQIKDIHRYTIEESPNNIPDYIVSFGFGFDYATSDYKVVRIVQSVVNRVEVYSSNEDLLLVNRVEVYSLNEDSWKEIEVELEFGRIECPLIPAIVDGSIYWMLARNDFDDYGVDILSFDLQSKRFSKILVPDSLENLWCHEEEEPCSEILVFEYKESVAITYTTLNKEMCIYFILHCKHFFLGFPTNKKDNDNCWIKKVSIKSLKTLHGCLKTGEFIGCNSCDEIVLYDPVNQVVKPIQHKPNNFETHCYTESLFNLN